jgi:DNA-binding response OmpR family regulator
MTQKKTILIIEDDEGIQKLLTFYIKKLGYQAELKKDGTSAQEWLALNKPDLILMDIMLPDITGIELCRWVNSQENIKDIPVIHMTNLTDDITQEDSMYAGARDFVIKPTGTSDFEILEKKIEVLVKWIKIRSMEKKKTILIIEDELGMQELLTYYIKDFGYNVVLRKDGVSAQEWLSSNNPDLIVMDIMLPDITGIELCRWVNSQEKIQHIPVIHMTSLTDDITQEDSMYAGARDFVIKPTGTSDFEILEKKIEVLSKINIILKTVQKQVLGCHFPLV